MKLLLSIAIALITASCGTAKKQTASAVGPPSKSRFVGTGIATTVPKYHATVFQNGAILEANSASVSPKTIIALDLEPSKGFDELHVEDTQGVWFDHYDTSSLPPGVEQSKGSLRGRKVGWYYALVYQAMANAKSVEPKAAEKKEKQGGSQPNPKGKVIEERQPDGSWKPVTAKQKNRPTLATKPKPSPSVAIKKPKGKDIVRAPREIERYKSLENTSGKTKQKDKGPDIRKHTAGGYTYEEKVPKLNRDEAVPPSDEPQVEAPSVSVTR